MEPTKQAVRDAVAELIWRRFDVRAERDRQFTWPVPADIRARLADGDLPATASVTADLYLPPPLHCLVQLDDPSHCTQARAALLATYPPDTPLNFDVRRARADRAAGDPALAMADALADLLPPRYGFNPTVRLRADEIAEQTGPLTERIESLLAHRFAVHAGTTFQKMIETAGAKPHRTRGTPADAA